MDKKNFFFYLFTPSFFLFADLLLFRFLRLPLGFHLHLNLPQFLLFLRVALLLQLDLHRAHVLVHLGDKRVVQNVNLVCFNLGIGL